MRSHSGFRSASIARLLRADSFKSLPHRGTGIRSAETEFDAVRTARKVPVDRVLADVLANDRARAEFDATFRVVHEFSLLDAVDLRRTHVQARLRVTRAADVRLDRDERLFVEFEPVQADAFVDGENLRSLGLRGFRHAFRRGEPVRHNQALTAPRAGPVIK